MAGGGIAHMKVEVKHGIEGIASFGDTKEIIISKIGKPDEINEEMRTDAVTYIYNPLKIRLHFDLNSKLLYSMDICSDNIILFDSKINAYSKTQFMELLHKNGINDAVYEDEDDDLIESIFSSDWLLAAEFEYDSLYLLEISVER